MWRKPTYVLPLTRRISVEEAVFQSGPGPMCVHTAKIMWPCAAQTTSECSLSDRISMRPHVNTRSEQGRHVHCSEGICHPNGTFSVFLTAMAQTHKLLFIKI